MFLGLTTPPTTNTKETVGGNTGGGDSLSTPTSRLSSRATRQGGRDGSKFLLLDASPLERFHLSLIDDDWMRKAKCDKLRSYMTNPLKNRPYEEAKKTEVRYVGFRTTLGI